MEKQILIPIIVVLGLLTCGIGIYLYIRYRNKPIEALEEVVVTEKINKPVETSVDNTTNVCDDIIIPVDDVEVVEENLDRIVRVGNLRMTERARRELQNGWQDVRQSYSTMMNNQIAGLERLEQGCDRIIEAGERRIEAGNAFIAHCDNMIQSCNNSIVFGTLALGMSAVSIDDEEIQNNLNN